MKTSKSESVQRAPDSEEHVRLCQTACNRNSVEIQAVPWGTQDKGHKFSYIQRKLCLGIHQRTFYLGDTHKDMTKRCASWGEKSSLFIFSNKYVFSYNVNNTGSGTFSLLNTNQKSLLSHSKSTKNIAPQREKSGMRSPLGFSQPFHRHLPRALFFQVLMERNKGFASLKISKLELGRQTVNKLLCSNKCYGMLQKHSNETFGKEMEHERRLAA